ncbi:MAG TPA: mevalonate kinase [Polyangia bacterium]|nr:mevalonate kinase [Polyangia bacterium]
MIRGQGFGHAKVILIGEHGVVHGHPALAAGLAVGVRVEAVTGSGRLSVPGWSLTAKAGDGSPVGRALAAILTRLRADDLDFRAEAAIPSRAGLGSSAAMAVAIARAAVAASAQRLEPGRAGDQDGLPRPDDDLPRLRRAVDDAEAVFHGTPSGIDAAAALGGGVGRFQRGLGWRPIAVAQAMRICIGLTGRPRDTSAQVAAVTRLRERVPTVGKMLALFGDLADAGERALAIGDVDGLGRLFDVAHGLLCALRVSSPEIEALVHGARAAGAIGAKLTGAGGGGAVIALAPAHEPDVIARWRRDGFDGFVTTIGNPDSIPAMGGGHDAEHARDRGSP